MTGALEPRIKQVMATVFGLDASAIADDASPDTIPQWDSLGHMNLVVALEEAFDIRFTDEQMIEMMNVPLIVCVLKETQGDS